MAARLRLPWLLADIRVDRRDTFFRSVSHPICLPNLKKRVPKSAGGTDACLPRVGAKPESGVGIILVVKLGSASAVIFEPDSNSSASTVLLPRICPAILMAFLVRVVVVALVVVVRFAAVADDSGWSLSSSSWFSSSRFSSLSLPADSSGGGCHDCYEGQNWCYQGEGS